MEKSENYYKREEHMRELKIPTFTEIQNVLGKNLGKAVIEECPDVLKKELGTEPKLHGAGDTLWTSPSDLLKELVVLKPPFTNRYIKALTHEGILFIGAQIENKFKNEMEQKCKQSLADQEEMLIFIAEEERIKAVRDALADRMKYYEEKFNSFEHDFEKRLREELELLTTRLLEDNDKVLQTQRGDMQEEWQDRLLNEVEETTTKLTVRFRDVLDCQEAEFIRKYELELKKMEAKHEVTLELEQSICKETLKQLKHNLECKNISNLIYVLCMERRKCEHDRLETEKQQKKIVSKLSKEVETSQSELQKLDASLKKEQEKLVIRERCLKAILKQFKKFVYFALKAAPKQGEFLLNIEKLLLYELTESVVKIGKNPEALPEFIPKRLPLKTEELIPQDLTLPLYHSCLDEADPPAGDSAEELFSVIFDDKMYVREDFRNMISQGIEIRPSNELWNKDVEELIVQLKTAIEDATMGRKQKRHSAPFVITPSTGTGISTAHNVPPHTNSIMVKPEQKNFFPNADNVEFSIPFDQTSRYEHDSKRSSVYFVDSVRDSPERPLTINESLKEMQSHQQKILTELLLESKPVHTNNLAELAQIQRNNSILLCVKDSLDHHRMSLRTGSLRDDIDMHKVYAARHNVLQEQHKECPTFNDDDVNERTQESLRSTPVLERIRKINEENLEGRKDIVEVKKSIERLLSDNLLNEGLLNVEDIRPVLQVTQVKDVKKMPVLTPRERRFSGLSMAQDSLEIIKSKTHVKDVEVKQNFQNVLNQTIAVSLEHQQKKVSPAPSYSSKVDKISIMETPQVIEPTAPAHYLRASHCSTERLEANTLFTSLPKIYHTGSIVVNPDATWRVYEHQYRAAPEMMPDQTSSDGSLKGIAKRDTKAPAQRDNFLKKENVARLAGIDQPINTCTTAFTVDRVHSLLGMLKEDPSLMRIFTACSR